MILIKQKAPSKAWRLVRNSITGDIFTGASAVYQYAPSDLTRRIDAAKLARSNGQTPEPLTKYYWRADSGIDTDQLEQLDHIPFCRGQMKFRSIHHGTSSIQLIFETASGGEYYLEGDSANDFFTRVGKGSIIMDAAGFYEFNFSFVKKSDKVFMTLEDDDMHV